jgi:hypothetical protein
VSPTPTTNQDYLTPGTSSSRPFPRMWPAHSNCCSRGLCPTGHLSPALATRPGHPCASTILVATLVQEEPKDSVGTHCCATMVSDHISATMTYEMWREVYLWHVNVFQRKHISNPVIFSYCLPTSVSSYVINFMVNVSNYFLFAADNCYYNICYKF